MNNRLGRANNGSITLKSHTGDVLSDAASIRKVFSKEFAKNFSSVEISSTFPAGSEGCLRFNCNLSDVKKYILATPNSAAGLMELVDLYWSFGSCNLSSAWHNFPAFHCPSKIPNRLEKCDYSASL